jgi:hypothetical protein
MYQNAGSESGAPGKGSAASKAFMASSTFNRIPFFGVKHAKTGFWLAVIIIGDCEHGTLAIA